MTKKYAILLSLLMICYSVFVKGQKHERQNYYTKLAKKSLSGLDTTGQVYDEHNNSLRYYQYAKLIYTGKYYIGMKDGKRSIMRLTGNPQTNDTIINNLIYYGLTMIDNIRVEKSKRKMYLERNGKVVFQFPVNLGKNPVGQKQKEGDGRTPEGLYAIDYNVNTNAAYYRGFHISYPNGKDSTNAKKLGANPGRDIMIHGTSPARSKLKDWTNGCIAISNAYIDTLSMYMRNGTPIEIRK
jgi:murein L,D-transpeptidase YafK